MQDSADSDNKKLLSNDQNKINVTKNDGDQSMFSAQNQTTEKSKANWKKYALFGTIGVAVILAIVLPITLVNNDDIPIPSPNNPPIPAPIPAPFLPYYNDYSTGGSVSNTQDSVSGFIITNTKYDGDHHSYALKKLTQNLPQAQFAPQNHNLGVNPNIIPSGPNNQFISNVSFNFFMTDFKVGYLVMTDAQNERYSIPTQAVRGASPNPTMRLEMLGFQLFQNPFSFSFTDVIDKSNVFVHTNHSTLVFMDKYMQMDLQLPSQRLFGLGERIREFQLSEGTWTMWAKGQDSPYDDGTGGKQVYGVHPFVLVQGKNKGDFFGMFFRNSNAQSPVLRYNPDGTSTLSYITTGGQIEIFFFIHGSAKSIIQQYQNFVGHPTLPPFWSLGWQQASWKYTDQSMVENVIQSYADANMPLDVMWLDIPYMNQYADFSVDTTTFPDIKGLADKLHSKGQKLVVILDAGLSADNLDNPYYKAAQQYKILIQSNVNPDKYEGALVMKVWPNHTVFIDWFNADVSKVWNQGLSDLYKLVPYDGIWLDMNEATGFCSGECPNGQQTTPTAEQQTQFVKQILRQLSANSEKPVLQDEAGTDYSWYYSYPDQNQQSTYNLPFVPGFSHGGNLDNMTLSLNATNPSINQTQYNVHSLYGLMMTKATQDFLLNSPDSPNKDNRPFILSRSTFSGSGQYTSHWLGDNWRDWAYMNYSIAGIMNMNMFGIPQAGADVCGFFGEKRDDEMCARWIQLATFYPFARAHQNLTWKGQDSERSEPYTLQGNWLEIARDALYDRYQYLRHMYTCLFEVNQWGGSCIDPLFYYYPTDDQCFENIEASFLVGGAVKVSPILRPGITQFESYFPAGIWVNLANYAEIIDTTNGGKKVTLHQQNTVNAHLRGGSIIPFQKNSDNRYKSVNSLINAPVSLIVNRDKNGFAYGTLLLDQGESISEIRNWQYEYLEFQFSAKSMSKLFAQGNLNTQTQYKLEEITILNAQDLADTDFACYMDSQFNPVQMKFRYDDGQKILEIISNGDAISFDDFKVVYYGNSKKDVNLCNSNSYNYNLKSSTPDLSKSTASFSISNAEGVLPDLNVTLQMVSPTIVNVKWTFLNQPSDKRVPFEVPTEVINPYINNKGAALKTFVQISNSPFQLTINGLDGSRLIDFKGFIFDQFLNIIKVEVQQNKDEFQGIMGLGEKATTSLFYPDGVYSMWALDTANPIETGKVPGNNLYGTHPFYMFRTKQASWTGVYTNLAAAQDWYIKNDQANGKIGINTVAIGGVADIYVIIGYSAKQVAADYWNYIVGRPTLVPAFALGWNQCKWGYKDTAALEDVVNNYSLNDIPLDTQWSDIDYLYAYRDFTYDTDRFAGLPQFIDSLHQKGMHYVPIVDAGIAQRPWGDYKQYNDGVEKDIYVKQASPNNRKDLTGEVWPNEAVYPDWFHPNVSSWYTQSYTDLHSQIAFDGLWLDMNEASDFCTGTCRLSQKSQDASVQSQLKYIPANRQLEQKSMSVDALHYGGVLELDTHSLYGAMEVMNAQKYFQANKKRTYIISRSTFAGSGKFGSLWLGDNFSDIKYLQASIQGTMMMNTFGLPLAGADICGFIGDTTPELCARWTVAGAFYPFSRNHNNYGNAAQEPYQFKNIYYEDGISYMDIMRVGIRNKYSVMKYYYTQFFEMSVFGSGPFYNPMFYAFPDDMNAYKNSSVNIMLGDALKLSVNTVALNQNITTFYFPQGRWCNIYNVTEPCLNSTGATYDLPSKAYDFYVHLYQGHIVPLQDAPMLNVLTTTELQEYPVDIHVLGTPQKFGQAWYASGSYVNDDGLNVNINGNYNQYTITAMSSTATSDTITVDITQQYTAYNWADKVQQGCNAVNNNDFLGTFYLYNAKEYNLLNSYQVSITFNNGTTINAGSAAYDTPSNRLVASNLGAICLPTVKQIVFIKTG